MSVYIIAESGVNHNGDINIAKKLAEIAKNSGADCVKFQTFVAENMTSKTAQKADYQKGTTNASENMLDMLKRLELSFDDFRELKAYCEKIGIDFLSTPFDNESIDFLESLNISTWKVPSGEITNLPYLVKIAKTGKPTILSTGMCDIAEIKAAIDLLNNYGSGEITLLHCNTAYPTPFCDINLHAMETLRKEFSLPVGYSDHSEGIEVSIAAVALGAVVIEKHFTLDKNMEGPDHKASIEPNELKRLVKSIRNIGFALGDGIKTPSPSERKNIDVARKSIVAKTKINKGDVFTETNLTTKRPGNGINPMQWFDIIGKMAHRDFYEDENIDI